MSVNCSFCEIMMHNINVELFYFFNQNFSNHIFNVAMPAITDFGGFVFLLAFLILLILFAKFKKMDTLKNMAILALIALLFSDVIVFCIKHIVNQPRPSLCLDNVNLLISEQDPYSFPSGHTASTLSVVTFFILNMKELVKKHYLAADILLILFAIVIPFSRMYVGVHYPGDILAGAAIGIFGALVVNSCKTRIISMSKQKS